MNMRGVMGWSAALAALVCFGCSCSDDTTPAGGAGSGGAPIGGQAGQGGEGGVGGAASGGSGGMGGAPEILCDDPESVAMPHYCLGNVTWPTVMPGAHTARLKFHREFADGSTLGLTVKLCALSDPMCTQPISEGVTAELGQGWNVELPMPTEGEGFTGYIEVTDPSGALGIPPNLIMTHRPHTNDINPDFGIIDNDVLGIVLQMLSTTQQPGHGHAAVGVQSCCDRPTAGASVAFDPVDSATVEGYLTGMLVDADATETSGDATAVVANLPAGIVKATGVIVAGNQWIGDVDLVIRDGAVTTVGLVPEPNP